MAEVEIKRGDRFAVFWGGGLGDILVIRPLLMALEDALEIPPDFFTTATHLQGLFQELGLRTALHILPKGPRAALRVFHDLGVHFDWLYLGPHPRIRTRLLAQGAGARRIWTRRHAGVDVFLGEQVLADVRAFGLKDPATIHLPYGGDWRSGAAASGGRAPYLVMHPGVKPGWQTKQWPDERWGDLIAKLLQESKFDLHLVGTPSESAHLEALVAGQAASLRPRLQIHADLDLDGLAATIRGSRGVICHNSGVLHFAAMLGRPTLSLTGSSPHYWRPPYPHVFNLTSGACGLACDQYRCPVPFYRARCIRELSVETVMHAARSRFLDGA